MNKFIEEHKNDLQNFTLMSHKVGIRNDYVQGGGGNTSVKFEDGLMAIKASGYCLSDIEPDHAYALLDYIKLRNFYNDNEPSNYDDVEKTGSIKVKEAAIKAEGIEQLRPSVESGFHSILNKYVIHSHSVYVNLAACSKEFRSIVKKALADMNYQWGIVKYTDPGSKLTFSIRDELKRVKSAAGETPAIIFLENHGLIVHHNDYMTCLKIHDEVNARIAAVFNITGDSFPKAAVLENKDGIVVSEAPFLEEQLRTGRYGRKELLEDALYPDQIVFLNGTLFFGDAESEPEKDTCKADIHSGKIVFNMSKEKAQVIVETLTAVIFIRDIIERNGYTLLAMGDAAKDFITNWESEKYRKSLMKK